MLDINQIFIRSFRIFKFLAIFFAILNPSPTFYILHLLTTSIRFLTALFCYYLCIQPTFHIFSQKKFIVITIITINNDNQFFRHSSFTIFYLSFYVTNPIVITNRPKSFINLLNGLRNKSKPHIIMVSKSTLSQTRVLFLKYCE